MLKNLNVGNKVRSQNRREANRLENMKAENFKKLHDLKEGFSLTDRINLSRFAQYKLESERARAAGDDETAAEKRLYWEDGYRALTPGAQNSAMEYLELVRQQKLIEQVAELGSLAIDANPETVPKKP